MAQQKHNPIKGISFDEGLDSRIPCGCQKACSGYDSAASKPHPRQVKLKHVLKKERFCGKCGNVLCRQCMEGHTPDACSATQRGCFTLDGLSAALVSGRQDVSGFSASATGVCPKDFEMPQQ
jgi:hypothetical protein